MKNKILVTLAVMVLLPVVSVNANIQKLGNPLQSGMDQSFSTNNNISVISAGNVHTLTWTGPLSINRGGTNASAFSGGSVLYFDGTKFSENNANFFWDNSNMRLGVGTNTPSSKLTIAGIVESTTGGFKFPDGTIQTTAASQPSPPNNRDGHNLLELYLENYLAGKQTPSKDIFFDGFSDNTKVGELSAATVNTTLKRLELGNTISLDTPNLQNLSVDNVNAPHSFSFTVGAGENRVIIMMSNTDTAFSSVDVDGNAMTLAGSQGTGSGSVQIHYFLNPSVGSHTINMNNARFTAWTIFTVFGVDQTAPFGIGSGTSGTAPGTYSVNVASSINDLIIGIIGGRDSGLGLQSFTVGSGVTSIGSSGNSITNQNSGKKQGLATSTPFAYSWSSPPASAFTGLFAIDLNSLNGGSYKSVLTSLQQPKKSVNLWVVRNWTARFNLANSVSQGATSLTVSGDQRSKFANGDTIDVYTSDNLARERKALSLAPTYASASNQTTLTFTPSISNSSGFGTTAFIERVDVIPKVSLVNKGSSDNFVNMTFKNSIVDFTNNEVKDEYEYVGAQAEEDFRVQLNLSRVDGSLAPYAKKVLVQLGD